MNLLLPSKRSRLADTALNSMADQSTDHSKVIESASAPVVASLSPAPGDVPVHRKRGRPPKKKSSKAPASKKARVSFSQVDLESDEMSGAVKERRSSSSRRSLSSPPPPRSPLCSLAPLWIHSQIAAPKVKQTTVFDPFKETMRYLKKHGRQPKPGTFLQTFATSSFNYIQIFALIFA